jgi:signal transduction histidine kinase
MVIVGPLSARDNREHLSETGSQGMLGIMAVPVSQSTGAIARQHGVPPRLTWSLLALAGLALMALLSVYGHYVVAAGIFAVAAFAVVLGMEYVRQRLRTANRELNAEIADRKQTETSLKRKERLLKQLLDVYERHRKIAVYEIHDGISQPLAAALMHSEASLQLLKKGEIVAAQDGFRKTVELLRGNLDETRRLMQELRPTILDDFGVIAAVDQLIARARDEEGTQVEWSYDVQFRRLAPPLETAVFRIIQEGLVNARRHSRSDRVRIALMQHGERLRLEIEDWGAGFDPGKISDSRFGLAGIRERATLLAGDAAVESAPGKGTRIAVELPVVEAPDDDDNGD